MKIRVGGGGVNAEGNSYTLPEEEIEVADDHFDKILRAMQNAPKTDYVIVHPDILVAIKKISG